ncbi:MAG TPA: magnesium chelatase subunit H [Pseudomonadales bacterium]|nr:magnesium chelatase subunit H [Pseudomonadales bacterium]
MACSVSPWRRSTMRKPTTAADTGSTTAAPMRVVVITLDNHLACATERANKTLAVDLPGVSVRQHAAVDFTDDPVALEACLDDIAHGDIIIATMLFMEPHIHAVLPALEARRDHCDAMICCMSAPDVMRNTRVGAFTMDGSSRGALSFLKKLKPKKAEAGSSGSAGARQVAMLRRIPQLLRFIPGTAQDVRAYFLTLQYWLSGSEENVVRMVRFLVDRYADGDRRALRGKVKSSQPIDYPELGIYHPDIDGRVGAELKDLPALRARSVKVRNAPRVGLLVMRSYVLAGNSAHYDGVIRAIEAHGLVVVPVFAAGLDARPAVEEFFLEDGKATIDALVSLTGFSLVGGPAYNDSEAAADLLARLDVPYIAAHALEFQSLDAWSASERGLAPLEATMMVAIPELDGSTGPMVFGGRREGTERGGDMFVDEERATMLAARVARLVELRHTAEAERQLAIVLFNFPPNGGATGTAAYLAVFESLLNTLRSLAAQGYDVDVPADVDALRTTLLEGNAAQFGTDANVAARIAVDDHVRRERRLAEIEAQWGPAPGRQLTDGATLQVLGAHFGKVFVGIQPAFGYEGDPMRLLFEKSFTPTHAFSAFYRWLREDLNANAVLHFGTHGALEFMPGKQVGMSADCWPDYLIGDLPNIYLYASNNPSEGMIAKRRAAATLVSYLTPPVTRAGLYRDLLDLREAVDRWRGLEREEGAQRAEMLPLIQALAVTVDLASVEPEWRMEDAEATIQSLWARIFEIEDTLIPDGLHVVGQPLSREARMELLESMGEAHDGHRPPQAALAVIVDGGSVRDAMAAMNDATDPDLAEQLQHLADSHALLAEDHELPALMRALGGRFIKPAPGGDLLRNPEVLPSGRNVHGFDPFRLPSPFAVRDGVRQASLLIERHMQDTQLMPEGIALVLWGTDNLKNEGAPIGQALALMGAEPRFDSYGRLAGARLISLEALGRPRIDVVMTLSGIFRDLLPMQTRLLAEAALLAASADEPVEQNFVRKHALAYAAANDCSLEDASLRVFSNADGAYGANVNLLLESGAWGESDELVDTYKNRKCFAYGVTGKPQPQGKLLDSVLTHVDLAYQNLDSVDLGVTTIDHYFDTLGGISLAAGKARGADIAVYIGDQTRGDDRVRTLAEQVELETRTRTLNPKWYEGMLAHGYEGVRQIEAQVTNTMGWSATTGKVDPWVYGQLTKTFVLDDTMRERLAALNPRASLKLAERLLEATERNYWTPDEDMLEALRGAREALEDRLEGVIPEAVVAA